MGFEKGNTHGRGRPKGSRNKLGEAFVSDLQADWEEFGAETLVKVREERPADYCKIIASLLPKDFNLNINPYDELSDTELDERIRQLFSVFSLEAGTALPNGGAQEAPTPKQIN